MPFSQVREALTALGASPFVQKVIDPTLVELQRRYMPVLRAIPTQRWTTDIYNFNQRTTVPSGGYVPDGGARTVANSAYVQLSFQMKHIQTVGAVTGYAQEVANLVDLRRTEIAGATQGYYWDAECGIMWGNSASTLNQAQPQFDGLDTLVSDFTTGYKNCIDFTNSTLTPGMLDQIADVVQKNAKEPVFNSQWMWIMSTTAHSRLAQLTSPGYGGLQRFSNQVEVDAGLIVDTYRNIPILDTSFLSAFGFSMGAVTTGTATTGGTLANATYWYRIAPVVSRAGEATASTEVSQVAGGSSTSTITLSFTPPTGYDALAPQLYKVYRSTSTGTETFLGYVDSTVGLSSDGVTPILTTSIIDTGSALVPQNGSTVPATLPTAYFGTNASMLPPAAGSENIYLISRNRRNVVRPYVREANMLNVYPTTSSPDALPFAIMGDTCFAVRASRFVGRGCRMAVALVN
jgi:hypothetical protein